MNEINWTMDTLMELYFHTRCPEALHYKYISGLRPLFAVAHWWGHTGTAGKVTFCIFYNEVRFIIGARPSAVAAEQS